MPTQSESTTIRLQHKISTNGKSYGPGSVEVPRDMADDLLRRDHEYQEYLNNLHTKRTSEVNAGTFSAGGGAE